MLVVLLQNRLIYILNNLSTEDIKKIKKNKKPHSAKLKMKLLKSTRKALKLV